MGYCIDFCCIAAQRLQGKRIPYTLNLQPELLLWLIGGVRVKVETRVRGGFVVSFKVYTTDSWSCRPAGQDTEPYTRNRNPRHGDGCENTSQELFSCYSYPTRINWMCHTHMVVYFSRMPSYRGPAVTIWVALDNLRNSFAYLWEQHMTDSVCEQDERLWIREISAAIVDTCAETTTAVKLFKFNAKFQ